MPDATPEDLVELGRIVSAFGVRGWVKVRPYSSEPEALLKAAQWWLAPHLAPAAMSAASSGVPSVRPFAVQSSRIHSDHLLAELKGVDGRDAAEALKGYTVWVSRSSFPAADDEEYYWVDLIGCQLYGDQDGQQVLLGVVSEVSENGAHAVLHVLREAPEAPPAATEGSKAKPRKPQTTLVPFVEAHVQSVDLKARRIDTNWPVDL